MLWFYIFIQKKNSTSRVDLIFRVGLTLSFLLHGWNLLYKIIKNFPIKTQTLKMFTKMEEMEVIYSCSS